MRRLRQGTTIRKYSQPLDARDAQDVEAERLPAQPFDQRGKATCERLHPLPAHHVESPLGLFPGKQPSLLTVSRAFTGALASPTGSGPTKLVIYARNAFMMTSFDLQPSGRLTTSPTSRSLLRSRLRVLGPVLPYNAASFVVNPANSF